MWAKLLIKRRLFTVVIALFLFVPVRGIWAALVDPSAEPVLRISTKMHEEWISRITVDSQQRFLVSASFDNTVRIWSLPDGGLARVLRMPIGFSVYSASISPDGGTVAVGGFSRSSGLGVSNDVADGASSKSVYLFERETGSLLRKFDGIQGPVSYLTYSRDGRYLAVTTGRGVRVYDVNANYTPLPSDSDYSGMSTWAEFDNQGRLATATADGYLRVYAAGSFRTPLIKMQSSKLPLSASTAMSPDGEFLALGDRESVSIYSAHDLRLLHTFSHEIITVPLSWSQDSQSLFVGDYSPQNGLQVRKWTNFDHPSFVAVAIPSLRPVTALKALENGSVLYATGDLSLGIAFGNEKVVKLQARETYDWGLTSGQALRITPDGKTVEMRSEQPERLVRFSTTERRVVSEQLPDPFLKEPTTDAQGVLVSNWIFSSGPSVNGHLIVLEANEISRTVAIDARDRMVVLGTDSWIRATDLEGKPLWKTPVPDVEAVNISDDGRLVVSAHADGTLRWRRRSDGRELLALLMHNDGQRWAAWTPEGYYDASVGGEDLIGWQVNRGPEDAPDFFPAAVFRARFYRPDLVGEILDTLDVWEAQKLADKAIGRRPEASDINDLLPPVIQIIAPQQGSKISQTSVTLSYHVRSAPTPLRGVRIAIDGRPISYQDRADLRCMDNRDCEGAVTISVPKKDVTITMIAESAVAASEPAELRLNWSGSQEQIKSKPNLYLLAVGVSHHSDPELDVKYASVDAQAFADVVRKQQDGIYANINMRIVLDESARLADIKEGLVWLKDNVRPTDVAMVFLAGQSKQRSATNYDFLPFDADSKRPELTFLHDFDLEYFLSNIPGKAFLFVDSCYAGGLTKFVASSSAPADINRLANNLAQNGVVVFTASASQQVALESDEWRHGAFTKALLEGLSGEAAGSSSKTISVSELASYVSNRVETLTAGRQTPSIAKPTFVPDAPIAAVVR